MASNPMYNTIGAQANDLATKLFGTINRRNELQSQGKLAELQANLQREERNFSATQQRLRDKDYQKFQERSREDTQAFRKQERIATQSYSSVEAKKQRDFTAYQSEMSARRSLATNLALQKLAYKRSEYENAKSEKERNAILTDAREIGNHLNQLKYGVKSNIGDPRQGTQTFKKLFLQTPMGAMFNFAFGQHEIDPQYQQIPENIPKQEILNYMSKHPQLSYEEAQQNVLNAVQVGGMNPQLRGAFGMGTESTYAPGQYQQGSGLRAVQDDLGQMFNTPVQPHQPALFNQTQPQGELVYDPKTGRYVQGGQAPQFNLGTFDQTYDTVVNKWRR